MSKLILPPEPSTINNMIMPQEKPRPHFGISGAGHKCERKLWLNFRWAVIEKFDPRILRLFRVGQEAENFMCKDLASAGIELKYTLNNQLYLDFGKHVGGSPDGIGRGFVEAPKAWHIVEFKTHNDKSFKALKSYGVEKSKPMHYSQVQDYMYKTGETLGIKIDRAFYLGANKNDSDYYRERIKLDKDFAINSIERAQRIALSEHMPEPMTKNPAWFECKFCPCYDFCYKKQLTKEVNCRTCAHSTPLKNGTWYCDKWKNVIPTAAQYIGCRAHVLHPDLMPYDINPQGSDNWNANYNGILNGEKGYSSKEVIAIIEKEENSNVRMEK